MHTLAWWNYILDMLAVWNVAAVDTGGFTLGTIAATALLGLVGLGALAVRAPGRWYRAVSVAMVVFVAVMIVLGIYLQRSFAMDMTPTVQYLLAPKGIRINNPIIKAPNYIYFTVEIADVPRWWRYPWSSQFEKEVLDKQKEAAEGGKEGKDNEQGLMLQFMPSDENREMPHIYLHPWPAQPSKGTLERPYEFQPTRF